MAGDYPEDRRNASQIKSATVPQAEEGMVVATSYSVPTPSAIRVLGFRFSDAWQTTLGNMRADALAEVDSGSLFNLVPVFIATGCVLYFLAPAEPLLATLLVPLPLWFVLTRVQKRGFAFHVLFGATLVFTGMSAAKISTLNSGTPIIERQLTATLTGTILAVDENRRGAPRYIIKPHSIEGVPAEQLPRLLRLSSASRQTVFTAGDSLTGLARIQPVSGPVYPGGYDFSFFAHFDELGGSGFFMGAPKPVSGPDLLQWNERVLVAINQTRSKIAARIRTVLPGMSGDVAVALVIGDKSGIPEEVQESLRATGLAHILAISGLHMALVTLTVIWVVRLLCALSPDFATRHPVKKLAALTGFLFATTYLAMSGWGVATQRAWIMISVMLCAVLLDRRAITMRSVAISAIIIVLLKPESLFSPGFQMSFSAVASLVAAYEALNRWSFRRREATNRDVQRTGFRGLARSTTTYFGSLAMTSLVAGSATSFIAAMHFHQVPALGLMANVIAMPVVSMLVMPFVLLSLILMPFGFEFLALYPVHHGIEWTVAISHWVESFGQQWITGRLPAAMFGAFLVAVLPLLLLKTRIRFAGLLIAAPLLAIPQPRSDPDILIAENGRAVAVANDNGEMSALFPQRDNFVTQVWARALGVRTMERLKKTQEECNRDRCIHVLPQSLTLHVVYDPDLLWSSCMRADILIAPRLRWVNCKSRVPRLILKRGDFESGGSHAIHMDRNLTGPGSTLRVETAMKLPTRPWQRKVTPFED